MRKNPITQVLHSGTTVAAEGSIMDVREYASVGVQVTGISVATITFRANIDGSNYVDIIAYNISTGLQATTATSDGIYIADVTSFSEFKADLTFWGAGTVVATAAATIIEHPSVLVGVLRNSATPDQGDTVLSVNIPFNFIHSELGWNPENGNYSQVALASAARTVATDSDDLINYNARGVIIVIDVSSITATPILTASIQLKAATPSTYFTIWTAAATITTQTMVAYQFMPGAAVGSYTESVNLVVPKDWRLHIAVADTDSATYSADVFYML